MGNVHTVQKTPLRGLFTTTCRGAVRISQTSCTYTHTNTPKRGCNKRSSTTTTKFRGRRCNAPLIIIINNKCAIYYYMRSESFGPSRDLFRLIRGIIIQHNVIWAGTIRTRYGKRTHLS